MRIGLCLQLWSPLFVLFIVLTLVTGCENPATNRSGAAGYTPEPTLVKNPYIQYAPGNVQDMLRDAWAGGILTGRFQAAPREPDNSCYQYLWVTLSSGEDMWGYGNGRAELLTNWQGSKNLPPAPPGADAYWKKLCKTADDSGYVYKTETTPLTKEMYEEQERKYQTDVKAPNENLGFAETTFRFVVVLGFIAICFVVYFLPTMIAIVRRIPQLTVTVVINLVLGWTILGWVVSLCFACWKYKDEPKKL